LSLLDILGPFWRLTIPSSTFHLPDLVPLSVHHMDIGHRHVAVDRKNGFASSHNPEEAKGK
jgi:hypothetical protein